MYQLQQPNCEEYRLAPAMAENESQDPGGSPPLSIAPYLGLSLWGDFTVSDHVSMKQKVQRLSFGLSSPPVTRSERGSEQGKEG